MRGLFGAESGLVFWLPLMCWEILCVAIQKCRHIISDDVDLAANSLALPCFQAAQPEVGVQTDDHSLKQLLVRFPRHREEARTVRGEATDQSVTRHQWAERSRI